jgi:hypothetical protein
MPVTGSIATRGLDGADAQQHRGEVRQRRRTQRRELLAQLGADTGECGILERRETCIGRFHRDDGRADVALEVESPARELEQVQRFGADPGPLGCIGARAQLGLAAAQLIDLRGQLAQRLQFRAQRHQARLQLVRRRSLL